MKIKRNKKHFKIDCYLIIICTLLVIIGIIIISLHFTTDLMLGQKSFLNQNKGFSPEVKKIFLLITAGFLPLTVGIIGWSIIIFYYIRHKRIIKEIQQANRKGKHEKTI